MANLKSLIYELERDNASFIAHCEGLRDDITDTGTSLNNDIYLKPSSADEDTDFETVSADELYKRAYAHKSYHVNLKPIYSAFYPGALSLTVLRALAVNFQSVMEAYIARLQEDDEEEEFAEEEPAPIDVEGALKGSGWTISREVTVVTTRRLLERFVVQRVSKRTAWKLLKDLPTSSKRKAERLLPKSELFLGVVKTTFRGQLLGIAATWLVQLLIDIYFYVRALYRRRRKTQTSVDYQVEKEELAFLLRKTVGNTLKCGAALALSSVGAGIGVVLMRPSWGQRIGNMAGEFAGAVGMSYLIDRWIIFGLSTARSTLQTYFTAR
ncbi:hypothetical protein GOP47_0004245 [Adiantum capillus-veneris]|uniref:Uncharacterized protein n=1 Tax=Adiantum capillus-veneris TaxID=13818 RepID=A0A9D4V7S4_ADICA|nr:hypothetical protein GOP47_0004245 [Adiantum capillus-veneris]